MTEPNNNLASRSRDWCLKGHDLMAVINDKLIGIEKLKQAEICGYYVEQENKNEVLHEEFNAAITEAEKEYDSAYASEEELHIINNKLCKKDRFYLAHLFLPERIILKDPAFYREAGFQSVDSYFFEEIYALDEEAAEQRLIDFNDEHGEPMQVIACIDLLVYLDGSDVPIVDIFTYFGYVKSEDFGSTVLDSTHLDEEWDCD